MKASYRALCMLSAFGILAAVSLTCVNSHVSASTGISTSATFRDDTTIPDRIRSDGAGPYVNGQQDIKAIIDGVGDFDLDTSNAPHGTRTLFIDFTSPASTSATPPFTSANVDVYFSTGGGGLPQMAVGDAKTMHVQIILPGGYFLEFNPNAQPGSSSVLVTRTSSNTWTIEASATSTAQLIQTTTSHGKTTVTNDGFFYMPFKITVQQL
ncbi:MAG TPA: hypothetical protein VFO34_05240 [Candidatus Acidoferrales bacterium]|nr:hypothetical protein [Candidatus Acidoferrales bacterium]